MGIKGLHGLIKKSSPDSMLCHDITKYKNKKIAIDSEILIYKFRTFAYKQKECAPEFYHIHAFLMNIIYHLSNGVIPIYVFDGIPPVSKQENCLVKRSEIKEKNKLKISEMEDKFLNACENDANDEETLLLLDELIKNQSNNPSVTKLHRQECKFFIKLLGIPMIAANGEAEALCVKMARNNLVDYVYTEDSDAITYAVASYLKESTDDKTSFSNDIKIIKKGPSQNFIEMNVNKILSDFKFDANQFLDFCILSGCDYCKNIPKIGPMTAYKIITDYKSIENYKNKTNKIPEDFNYLEVRDIFINPDIQLPEKQDVMIKEINIETLEKFLNDEMKINSIPIISKYKRALMEFKKITSNEDDSDIYSRISVNLFR